MRMRFSSVPYAEVANVSIRHHMGSGREFGGRSPPEIDY